MVIICQISKSPPTLNASAGRPASPPSQPHPQPPLPRRGGLESSSLKVCLVIKYLVSSIWHPASLLRQASAGWPASPPTPSPKERGLEPSSLKVCQMIQYQASKIQQLSLNLQRSYQLKITSPRQTWTSDARTPSLTPNPLSSWRGCLESLTITRLSYDPVSSI